MNNLTPLSDFHHEAFGALRTVVDDGRVMFCGKDAAQALGYVNTKDALSRHCKGVVKHYPLETAGGIQQVRFITEGDLYRLIASSKLPSAQQFETWVFDEVLPAIRKTGQYSTASALEAQIPKTLPDALRAYAREVEAREAMEAYARELEPKADNYDRFMSADGTYSVGSVAKMLGLSQNKLFAELRNRGVLIAKGAMANTPYQQYMHHFAVKAYEYTRSDGTVGSSYTTRVQPSGVDFIARKLGRAIQEAAA